MYSLSCDISLRHGAFTLWKDNKPIDVMVWEDKNKNDYYKNCDEILLNFLKFVEKNYLKITDISYIFIEEPLLGGPNQFTIIKLMSFVCIVSYALYFYTKTVPKMLNQSRIKTFIVGKQPRSINKKVLVEEKILKSYLEIFEKLPNKRKNNEGDIYKRKYKTHISDCADSLALGLFGLNVYLIQQKT